MEQQTILIPLTRTKWYIGFFFLGLLIGGTGAFAYFEYALSKKGTFQSGWDAARLRVEQSSVGEMLRTPDTIITLSGTVLSVGDGRIMFRSQLVDPFSDPLLDTRIATITPGTKIFRLSQKDPKVLQAEMETYLKKMGTERGVPAPAQAPDLFVRTPAELVDIQVNTPITVTAEENIKTKKEFSVNEILIQENVGNR